MPLGFVAVEPDVAVEMRLEQVRLVGGRRRIVALPCLLGRDDPALIKCFDAGGVKRPELWVLAHPKARRLPHVRAFVHVLTAHVLANEARLYDESVG